MIGVIQHYSTLAGSNGVRWSGPCSITRLLGNVGPNSGCIPKLPRISVLLCLKWNEWNLNLQWRFNCLDKAYRLTCYHLTCYWINYFSPNLVFKHCRAGTQLIISRVKGHPSQSGWELQTWVSDEGVSARLLKSHWIVMWLLSSRLDPVSWNPV